MNRSLRFHLQQFARAWRIVWSSSRGWTVLSIALLLFQGFLPLVSLYLYKLIIDVVEASLTGTTAPLYGHLALLILAAASGALLAGFAAAYGKYVAGVQAQQVADSVQRMVQAKSTDLDLAYYDDPTHHDMIQRAQDGSSSKPAEIVNSLVTLTQNSLSLLLLAGLLIAFHWSIGLLFILSLLPGAVWQLRSADQIYYWHRRRTVTQRKAGYWHWLLTSMRHASEVRVFQLGPRFMERFKTLQAQLLRERASLERTRATAEFVTQASSTLVIFVVFGFLAFQTVAGLVTLGTLVVTFQAFQRAQGFAHSAIAAIMKFYENSMYLSDAYEFLELPTRMGSPDEASTSLPPFGDSIRLDHVSYRYPKSSRPVLKDICLTIERGQVVAIVGENGAGKTTLVKLLCRFDDPTAGQILVDGQDLRAFSPSAWQDQVAVILQDYIWYHQMTVSESIALGRASAPLDEDAVRSAAVHSGAHDFVPGLPDGYESHLGKQFGGTELSVGQWQKIALARAFYRDAQLLILDEPSSALDPLAEAEVFERFHYLTRHQTAILISHRLANVKSADRIFVLADGCLVESGTHDELVALDGAYKHLYETQARGYR